jgi:hypothetical protein
VSELRRHLPETSALVDGLRAIFANGNCGDTVAVLDRSSNVYSSTAPSEIVTCRVGDGHEL